MPGSFPGSARRASIPGSVDSVNDLEARASKEGPNIAKEAPIVAACPEIVTWGVAFVTRGEAFVTWELSIVTRAPCFVATRNWIVATLSLGSWVAPFFVTELGDSVAGAPPFSSNARTLSATNRSIVTETGENVAKRREFVAFCLQFVTEWSRLSAFTICFVTEC
jgi:hypothetical protein